MNALFAATEQLCMSSSPSSVTTREIAAAANVNHGLIHHYFGSKQALIGAAMQRVEEGLLESVGDSTDPAVVAARFIDVAVARPSYPRMLNWMLLEGLNPADHIPGFPLVDHLIELVSTTAPSHEARLRVFALLAFTVGMSTTWSSIADFTGLSDDERAHSQVFARHVARAITTELTAYPGEAPP
jgi:AcrR family transcriptional regulator